MDPKKKKTKRPGGAERERVKRKKAREEEGAKCHKLTDMFRAPSSSSKRDDAATATTSKLFLNTGSQVSQHTCVEWGSLSSPGELEEAR